MRTLLPWLTAGALVAASAAVSAPACEPGKGYVAVDTAQQVHEEFLTKLKGAGIGTIIRYYDCRERMLSLRRDVTRQERKSATLVSHSSRQ